MADEELDYIIGRRHKSPEEDQLIDIHNTLENIESTLDLLASSFRKSNSVNGILLTIVVLLVIIAYKIH